MDGTSEDPTQQTPEHAHVADGPTVAVLARVLSDAVFLTDLDGHITFMNPAAEALFGWTLPELSGRSLHDALHGEGSAGVPAPRASCRICAVLSPSALFASAPMTAQAGSFLHKDGRRLSLPFSSAPLLWQGRLVGAALVVRDSRALDAATEELARLKARLEEVSAQQQRTEADLHEKKTRSAEEAKRSELEQQLIGIVSHDLRNPLQAIQLYASFGLRVSDPDSRQRRPFERILFSSNRAIRMITDLLDYTRVRLGGGMPVERKATDLHDLVLQVVDEMRVIRPERQIAVRSEGDGLGCWDADRLSQVVQNLVDNALQHTTEDAAVSVHTRAQGDGLILEVHNEGPPIASEDLPRLFQPFQHGRAATGRSMGLGLHITSHIVRAHGGEIDVRSQLGSGTTFTVWLPRGEVPEGAARR